MEIGSKAMPKRASGATLRPPGFGHLPFSFESR